MIEVSCPKCNRILMVYSDCFVFDEDIQVRSECCDEVFYISYETESDCNKRRSLENKKFTKHSWTKETMDACREVFIDGMLDAYFNLENHQDKVAKILRLIHQYSVIERTAK